MCYSNEIHHPKVTAVYMCLALAKTVCGIFDYVAIYSEYYLPVYICPVCACIITIIHRMF